MLNIYPSFVSQDMAFQSKRVTLQNQATVISSALSDLEALSNENVERVIELLDLGEMTRIIVTDQSALTLYDTDDMELTLNHYVLFPEITRALLGYDVFTSDFYDEAFHSTMAMPVMNRSEIIGCVYLYEYDSEQAALLLDVQDTLLNISVIVGGLVIVLCAFLSRGLTGRISKLLTAIRIVREGEYGHRMKISGNDELAELGVEFNNLTDRLEKTEEVRRRFVSDASHELKTPLASIRLLTDSILQSEHMDIDTIHEFVSDIGEEAERLSRMTEKLLNLTRLNDAPPKDNEPVDLVKVAKKVIHTLQPLAAAPGIEILIDADESVLTLSDPDDMYQVIFNVVENAIKYNNPGGKVQIKVFKHGRFAELKVDDNGIGVPEEDLEHIFDRFYRVEKARSRETGGAGIGLAIVRDTIKKYKGEITAERGELGGMCFSIKLPLYMEVKK